MGSKKQGATKVVVTGAGGFIGSHLCGALSTAGLYTAAMDVIHPKCPCDEVVIGDLAEEGAWCTVLDGADTVFHLAGKAHALSRGKQDDAEYFRINTEGTRNLLAAAKRAAVKRLVFFSTIKAMSRDGCGQPTGEMDGKGCRPRADAAGSARAFTEEDVIEPDTAYGKSKLEAEKLVLLGGYVPEPVVLRLCMVYGVGAKGNMQKMLAAVSQHRFPPLPEVGNRRSMICVTDVVRAAVLAGKHPDAVGQVFIVSDGHAYSTRQIYEIMCRALDRKPSSWAMPLWILQCLGKLGDQLGRLRGHRFVFDSDALEKLVGSAWFNSEKIERRLGFKPEWNLERVIPEMVAALKLS